MDRQEEQRLERKLQQLEAELNQQPAIQTNFEPSESLKSLYNNFKTWYAGLSSVGKGAVAVVGVVFGLSLVSTVLTLIRLSVTLALLGVLMYVAYKFFLAPKSLENKNE